MVGFNDGNKVLESGITPGLSQKRVHIKGPEMEQLTPDLLGQILVRC